MILPTKGIAPNHALLSIGAVVLRALDEPKTVSRLWDDIRRDKASDSVGFSFDWFGLALSLLYIMGTIEQSGGRIVRREVTVEVQG